MAMDPDDFFDDFDEVWSAREIHRNARNSTTHWRTRDGRTIPITEMEDSHLVNVVHFLERTYSKRPLPPIYDALIVEGKKRGLFVDIEMDARTEGEKKQQEEEAERREPSRWTYLEVD